MKSKIALLVAIVLGILAAMAVRQYVNKEKMAIFAGKIPVSVITASRELRPGDVVTGAAITRKAYPQEFLPPGCIAWNDHTTVIGQKVNKTVKRGDALQWADLLEAEKAVTLRDRIAFGERAYTISVGMVSGVGGMIRPGDRIDIYGTFRSRAGDIGMDGAVAGAGTSSTVYPILRSVEVLATDQNLTARQLGLNRRQMKGGKQGYSTLTLNLTPVEIEVLVHAQETGNITVALRNRDELVDQTDLDPVTSKNFWEQQKAAAEARKKSLLKAYGTEDTELEEEN